MDIPSIPQNLDDWNMDVIDSLLNIPTIESEKLECKREIRVDVLSKSICALANTRGGFILVGLGEKKADDGRKSGYEKIGLDSDEDTIRQQIASATHVIDPIPGIDPKCIGAGGKMCVVIHVPEEKSKKPFFVADRGCYVRVGSSSFPASRSVVMNLFEGQTRKRNIASLLASLKILKVELGATVGYIGKISTRDQTRPAPVDVRFVMADVMKNQAFLVENKLFGDVNGGYVTQGILKALQAVRRLNAQVAAYNTEPDPALKEKIRATITVPYSVLSGDLRDAPSIIDDIISKCQSALDKYE